MFLRRINNIYHAQYRDLSGQITSRSLHTTERAEAARLADALQAALQAARKQRNFERLLHAVDYHPAPQTAPVPKALDPKRVKLPELFAIAQKYRRLGCDHGKAFRHFCAKMADTHTFADEITPAIALDYLQQNYGEKSAKTYNNMRSMLDIIFRASLVDARLKASPFASLLPRRVDAAEVEHYRSFTFAEVEEIFENLKKNSPFWHCLCEIAYSTGMRLETCRALALEHISGDVITIMPGKTARFGRAVQIPLVPRLKAYLATLHPATAATPFCKEFPEPPREWHSTKTAWFSGFLNALKISDTSEGKVGFHSWRVTFVSRLSAAGVDERVIRGIVGHASAQMTDLYNHDITLAQKQLANFR